LLAIDLVGDEDDVGEVTVLASYAMKEDGREVEAHSPCWPRM
jgi:hypothetical protein